MKGRKRNEAATCSSCPFNFDGEAGLDCRLKPQPLEVDPGYWCGEHPDFWDNGATPFESQLIRRIGELEAGPSMVVAVVRRHGTQVSVALFNSQGSAVKVALEMAGAEGLNQVDGRRWVGTDQELVIEALEVRR